LGEVISILTADANSAGALNARKASLITWADELCKMFVGGIFRA
jgi:hypothetical protein